MILATTAGIRKRGQYPFSRARNKGEYEARRQAIFVSVDTANAKEGRGGGYQAPLVQWPGQGDGLPLPENMHGTLNNRRTNYKLNSLLARTRQQTKLTTNERTHARTDGRTYVTRQ